MIPYHDSLVFFDGDIALEKRYPPSQKSDITPPLSLSLSGGYGIHYHVIRIRVIEYKLQKYVKRWYSNDFGLCDTDPWLFRLSKLRTIASLQWSHRQLGCLFDSSFRRTSRENRRSPVDSPHKRPVMRRAFPWHGVIIFPVIQHNVM